MTENEAKGFLQGRLDCMNKCDVFDCKGTDECDGCDYCYSQGNFRKQKKALETAIQALEEIKQYRAIGTVEELKAYKQGNCTNDCKHYDSAIEYVRNNAIDEFAHQFKENLNQEFPSNYESTRPYFSLENARLLVDEIAEQLKAGADNE